jgi:hypothetical protein
VKLFIALGCLGNYTEGTGCLLWDILKEAQRQKVAVLMLAGARERE